MGAGRRVTGDTTPTAHDAAPARRRETAHVTCLGCGCACDDIDVVVDGGHIAEARNACSLGRAWFGDGRVPGRVVVDGRDASLDEALDTAIALLHRAPRPFVHLAPDISCEVQREGVAIADILHARLDTATSAGALPVVLAAQERGWAGATLGEIRNRSDAILFWGIDPNVRYPRYWSRYAPEPAGVFVAGRPARRVIAVDVGVRHGPTDADFRVAVAAPDEIDTLVALRALASTRANGDAGRAEYAACTGPAWEQARALLAAIREARYLTIVFDAEAPGADQDALGRADALIALAQTLNADTRCALSLLRAGGNRSGADAVVTAQTGYPAAVDFGRGYPRYLPYAGSWPEKLGGGGADAALVLGSAAALPAVVRAFLARVSCVVIGPAASATSLGSARVAIDTGVAGIHEGGTALRMDDVPLPLRPSVPSPRDTLDVVRSLGGRLAATAAEARS